MTTSEIATVLAWHDALNERDFDTLLSLSSDDIEFGDAKGAAQGHDALLDWAQSADVRAASLAGCMCTTGSWSSNKDHVGHGRHHGGGGVPCRA